MDPVRLLREWIARAVALGGQVSIMSPKSTLFVAASTFDTLTREAVEAERRRCLDILNREVRAAIDDGRTSPGQILTAIRRAETAIREGR